MNNPISTYRLQFHKSFTFQDFDNIIPYLHGLGIKTIYSSPIFEAVSGSVHGYDGINPHKINPEIGTEAELYTVSRKLKESGMQWLQDIVPNHMAFDPGNIWLNDVLEKGEKSVYASFFDVPWTDKLYKGKIMLPFLGDTLQQVIENGELKILFEDLHFVLKYHDTSWPIRLRTYLYVLEAGAGEPNQAIEQLLQQLHLIRREEEPVTYHETLHEFQLQLAALIKNETTKDYIQKCIETVNNNKDLIKKIADEQVYQLVNWQKTEYKINFRRFFTINGLICLNMQDQGVFQHYHSYIKHLHDEGIFQGLRIDHVDGLFDPLLYLEQLRSMTGRDTYIIVEKILEASEKMPVEWPVQGSTGYDFLSIVNNVFTNRKSKVLFTECYKQLSGNKKTIKEQIHESKALLLQNYMGGELENLYRLFIDLSLAENEVLEKLPDGKLKEVIAQFLIQCPVYRYYGNSMPLSKTEGAAIKNILETIIANAGELAEAVHILEEAWLVKPKENNEDYNKNALRFYQRCMQFTGPLMAKGVEDTLMYTYNRLIVHNEVGDAPAAFGYSAQQFHALMADRQVKWPLSLSATSTHDTKRGEDVRARLNVLTDLGEEWFALVEEWRTMNAMLKLQQQPDANDEYLIYQAIIGAMPMPGTDDNFCNRLQDYLEKALREAKVHSNWTRPDEVYEQTTKEFAAKLLANSTVFWKSFQKFHSKVADFGIVNSLAQLVLKFTCPGVPDTYQGTELWDLSMVDPDNRRLIDYDLRKDILDKLCNHSSDTTFMHHLWKERYSGGIKLWLLYQMQMLRGKHVTLFAEGDYIPLQVAGAYQDNLLAFARHYKSEWILIAIPMHIADVCNYDAAQILHADWKDTCILLPRDGPHHFKDIFEKSFSNVGGIIYVKDIFSDLPFSILKLQEK